MAELLAFTADHVRRLTGLSTRQIRYWDDTEFFSPTLVEGHRRRAFGRIYTFRDVVGLRTIAILRKQHRIPLQELRRVGAWLHEHHETPWASLKFALAGRKVVFFDPYSGVAIEPRDKGQIVFSAHLYLEPIANEMNREAAKLRERGSQEYGKIIRNRFVQHNAWVLSGTRVPTAAVWNLHSAGYKVDSIVREFPRLTEGDVRAAIQFEANRRKAA